MMSKRFFSMLGRSKTDSVPGDSSSIKDSHSINVTVRNGNVDMNPGRSNDRSDSYVNLSGPKSSEGHFEADHSTLITVHSEPSFPVSLQEVDLQRMDRLYPPTMPRLYNHMVYWSVEFLLPLVRFLFFIFEAFIFVYFLRVSITRNIDHVPKDTDSVSNAIIYAMHFEPALNPVYWLTLLYLPMQTLLFLLYIGRDMYWLGWREYRRTDNLIRLMANRHSRSFHCQFSYLKWRLFQLIRSQCTLQERASGWVVRSLDDWKRFVFIRSPLFAFTLRGFCLTVLMPYEPVDPHIQILLAFFFASRSLVYIVSLANKLGCLLLYAVWIRPATGLPGQRQSANRYWSRAVLSCMQRNFTKCMISVNGGNNAAAIKGSSQLAASQITQTDPVLFIPSSASSDCSSQASLDSVSLGHLTPRWAERKPENLRIQI